MPEKTAVRGQQRVHELLSQYELQFVANWQGDASQAVMAGRQPGSNFNSAGPVGCKLLSRPHVLRAVMAKQEAMIRFMGEETARRLMANAVPPAAADEPEGTA